MKFFFSTIFFMLAFLGEMDQSLKGHPFNISQIIDGALHHEHLIILCCSLGFLFLLIGSWEIVFKRRMNRENLYKVKQ